MEGSIRVEAILGREVKGCFVLEVWDLWDCFMGMCIWNWVSVGIPCFVFVNFYSLQGWGGGNLYDCMGYFKVIAYVLYCIICNVEFSMAC